MDPKLCLLMARDALKHDRADCADHLHDYFKWRLKGGFEPIMEIGRKGDQFFHQILMGLGEVADTLSNALSRRESGE